MGRPKNVRLVRSDGTELPCELIHVGPDEDGLDIWEICGIEFHPERGDTITVGRFPARTGITVAAPNMGVTDA